ncbi:hypothetical protein [Variovorax sp. PAMC 28711]|uniref:hypothetical protein n=1 Tax=Variovorax sp. PAMC 28711 TaxID=1795631 RepID=UPI00078CBFE4|nr:hypothetical protein [Variovorax sp. PAMC 28711]AMM24133.1 hypothetical protein AX767_07045 [Variovorax sp. PAMC 28711]
MNKVLAALLTGLFAVGVYAQSSPPGVAVPPNTPGVAGDRATAAGEMRKDRRPAGIAKPRSGDRPMVAEGGAVGADKAAVAGEMRAETRDERRPGKRPSMQGGTPK